MSEFPRRPGALIPTLLVYRECPCGNWLATGEGAMAPVCGECGGHFVPGGGPKRSEQPMFGKDQDAARQIRGLGFVAVLMGEQAAAKLVYSAFFGAGLQFALGRARGEDGGYYTEEERRLASEEISDGKFEQATGS